MSAVWFRFRAELRGRGRAWLGLALLVGLASGAVMALAAGARRTDSAYARFLVAHKAYDVMVVNYPAENYAVFDFDELARLPEVADAARAGFDYLPSTTTSYLASRDGRIGTEINELEILEGRRADPGAPDEAVVGFALADEHGLEVGDVLDTAAPGVPGGGLRVVGIAAAPGEFPPQFQFARPLVHVSPAFADAVAHDPDNEALMVRLHGGSDAVDGFLAALEARSGGQTLQVFTQREHAPVVDRSIHLQAVALWLLAGLGALVAALILGQVLARASYLESDEHPTLAALGMTRRERAVLGLLRSAAIAAVGAAVGVGVALPASALFPTGLARTAEPELGLDVDLVVLPAGAALTVAVVVALSAWPVWRAAGTTSAAPEAAGTDARTLPRRLTSALAGAPAAVGVGVRMALEPGRGRSAVPVRTTLGAVTLGITALTAATTFGASLAHLLDTPRLYGVTWDLELIPLVDPGDEPDHHDVLLDDDRVTGLAAGSASFGGELEVDGARVQVIALESLKGGTTPPILEGRPPAAADELVVGARTLRTIGADLGDVLPVRTPGHPNTVHMRLVGTAVFPAISERAQLGEGALAAREARAVLDPEQSGGGADNVIVSLAPGVDGDEVAADLGEHLEAEVLPIEPVVPNDIVNFGRVESMPFVLGGMLAAIAAATLAHLLTSAVRRRRRDLAVLKTLGFVRRQVAATVAAQATTVAAVGLIVGVPVGVALGRWTWTLMAETVGVVPEPRVPGAALAAIVVTTVVVANAIAILPGQVAARTRAAIVLRSE